MKKEEGEEVEEKEEKRTGNIEILELRSLA